MSIQFLESLESRVEFFKKGKIIPQRILKGPREEKHRFTFGSDTYVVPTKSGYLCIVYCGEQGCSIRISSGRNDLELFGSPYTPSGGTIWIGNAGHSYEKFANDIFNNYIKMNQTGA